jgi:FG-GAP-like repeat/Abnormal spindle-like microcephaly-assoc'd, ASPM-SPD-2-Hydin/FG-GAP repeat
MRLNSNRRATRLVAALGLIAFCAGLSGQAQATSNPVPYIVSLSPVTVAPGGGGFTLTVNGANFVSGSTVFWGTRLTNTALVTSADGPDQLKAMVPAAYVASGGTAFITVQSPGPTDLPLVSNEAYLTVTQPTSSLAFRLTAQSPSAGYHPNVPIVADFNNDGILDLAISNQSGASGNVSIFLGLGSGAFGAATNYEVANGPEGMAVGDFNGDGKLDLAVVNMDNSSYSILIGNGDGTFQTPVTTTFPVMGTFPYAIAAADFNQDGILDLAVACQDPSTGGFVYILLGDGSGTFGTPQHYGSIGQPEGIAVGDFNGDGFLDLAVSDFTNSEVWVMNGSGTGIFSAGTGYLLAPATGTADVVANDFNGDGQTDLAAVNLTSGSISVLLNSSGSFTLSAQSPIALPGGGYFMSTADLNGDTYPDLAVADYSSNTFASLFGNGDGTFQSPVSYSVDSNATSILGLALADLNFDGRYDVVTTDLPDDVVEVSLQTAVLNPDPSSLTFPNTALGTSSASMPITLANTGSASLVIRQISSTDPTDFPQTNTCGTLPVTLWVGQSCTVSVTFTPGTEGTRTGSISIVDNVSSGPQTVPLTGLGLAPEASLSPTSLSFANQFEQTTSTAQTTTLTNSGNAALLISSIGVTGDFAETNTCGASLAASSSCSISVTFKPVSQGSLGGTLTVYDNSNDGSSATQTASLGGTGVPLPGLAPAGLTFTGQLVGSPSATQNLVLSNASTYALSIPAGGIVVGGANATDFSQTNTCGTSVAAGGSCTITVTFTPKATGARSAMITISDSISGVNGGSTQIQTATLSGTGTVPVASVPSSVPAFAATLVGTSASPAQSVTLSNATGTAPLSITSIVIGGTNAGDFSQTNTCGTSVVAGGSCSITVSFKPTATGLRSATLTLTDDNNAVSGSTQNVSLSGTGTAPVVSLSTTTLPAFAAQLVGTKSAVQTITLTNTGSASLVITGIVPTGTDPADFIESNTCGTSLAAGSNCTIDITFAPAASGALTASITITDDNNAVSGSAQTVNLSGTGTETGVTLSTSSLTFPSENVGTASTVQPVTITNSGTAALAITSIAVSGDFSVSNPCGTSLAVGADCVVNVAFKPTAIGSRAGSVVVTDDAPTATQSVSLTGTGLGAEASLSADSLAFSAELVGVTSSAKSITVSNTGNAAMTVSSIAANGDFAESNTCGSSVAAGASCTVSVSFAAKAGGTRSGTLTLTDSSLGTTPQTVALSGTGQDFSLTATSSSANVSPGQNATYSVTLTPSGGFTQTVALTCGGLTSSSEASCSVSPASVTPTGATPLTVTVTTTAPSHLTPISRPNPLPPGRQGEWVLVALIGLAGMTWLARRRPEALSTRLRLAMVAACMAILLVLGMAGCGGSSSSSTTTTLSGGTPGGNYSITLTGSATSGSVTDSHSVSLALTVQ